MRDRTTPDEKQAQEPKQQEGRERPRTKSIHIGKIQYRFLKQVEEQGIDDKLNNSARSMVDKIKQYPLEPRHVMKAWERATKDAIADFKAGRGKQEDRDEKHRTFAVVFSALPTAGSVAHKAELLVRIDALRSQSVAKSPTAAQTQSPPPKTIVRRNVDKKAQEATTNVAARQPTPTQSTPTQGKQQNAQKQIEMPGATAPRDKQAQQRQEDARLEKALDTLRALPDKTQEAIELSARSMVVDGFHNQVSALEAYPAALDALKTNPTAHNATHALTLVLIAKTPGYGQMIRELADRSADERAEVRAAATTRLEEYWPDLGPVMLDEAQVGAAMRAVITPTAENKMEALILAETRGLQDDKQHAPMSLEEAGYELAAYPV